MSGAGGFLPGRGTYEMFAAHWKYVASTTLNEPLEWHNSTLLRGDLREAVTALKSEEGRDLHVIGSPGLIQSLMEYGLVDELQLEHVARRRFAQ